MSEGRRDDLAARQAALSPEKRALLARRLQAASSPPPASAAEPLAIVGMDCRFPGADGLDAFWALIREGVDAIVEAPSDRWDLARLYDASGAAGKVSTRWGGFLNDIDCFDATFFGIAPREALRMDPQQRLLLEVAWRALEQAGQTRESLAGSATGVFVGVHSHSNDYAQLQFADPRDLDGFAGTGTAHNFLSGRLSYLLDLHGPSLSIDTACSSSLVAVHLACQSLRAGESRLAIAGGVNLMVTPDFTIAASRMHMLSPDGRCFAFDERANGFVRAEGCGVVVIKRLRDAVAAGDRVMAVIRGEAVNQDGRTNGITAPNGRAQEAVIREALRQSGVDPGQVTCIEAHGTGTALGDPIEVEALAQVYGRVSADSAAPCALGSVKANLGHLEGAAGVAGLIKAALCLHHGQIAPVALFKSLNPHITIAGTRLEIPTTARPWTSTGPRFAAVSSFGWSGTNVHIVLESAPLPEPAVLDGPAETLQPFVVSAATPSALAALADATAGWLDAGPASWRDAVWSAARRRTHHEHRIIVSARSSVDAAARLRSVRTGIADPAVNSGRAGAARSGLAFVFPGQGSQWLGMGRDLMASEPVARRALEQCDEAIRRWAGWSVIDELTQTEEEPSRLGRIDVVQPSLFAVQIALAALWRAWGFEPDVVVGHSMGEVAAAHVAGMLTLDDAARIICRRSALLTRVSGQGAMALIEMSIEETRALLIGQEDRLSIAVNNGRRSTVVAGDPPSVAALLETLQAREIFCKAINVDVASHSPQMDALRADLLSALEGIAPQAGASAMLSTVAARRIEGGELGAPYWARNLREPVLFGQAIEQLIAEGVTRFVEISAHPVLLQAIEAALAEPREAAGDPAAAELAVASLRRGEPARAALLDSLGRLYVTGAAPNWDAIIPPGRFIPGPRYPFDRDRFWHDSRRGHGGANVATPAGARSVHPLLGAAIELAHRPGARMWQFELATELALPLVIELALAAGQSVTAAAALTLRNVEQVRVVAATPDGAAPRIVQASMVAGVDSGFEFQLHDVSEAAPALLARAEIFGGVTAATESSTTTFRSIDLPPATEPGGPVAIAAVIQAALACVSGSAGLDDQVWYRCREVHASGHVAHPQRVRVLDETDPAAKTVAVDDAANASILELAGLEAQSTPEANERIDDSMYEVAWVERAEAGASTIQPPVRRETWLIVGDGEVARSVAAALERKGHAVHVLPAAGDLQPAISACVGLAAPECAGLVLLDALEAPGAPGSPDELSVALDRVAVTAVRLVQAVGRIVWARAPKLWFVTRGAQAAEGPVTAPVHTALWGIGRVVAEEHPDLYGGLIDLDPVASVAADIEAVMKTVGQSDGETEVAWRSGRRHVSRLTRLSKEVPSAPVRWRPDAAYVLTGAFGGVGETLAHWMVSQGARRLILIGRTPIPPRSEWGAHAHGSPIGRRIETIRKLERAGTSVHVLAADVADQAAMSAFFSTWRLEGWPPIRGVVHAATVFDKALLATTSPDSLTAAFRAKAVAAVVLSHHVGDDLEFFVSCSSIAAVLTQPGLGSYAAANAFLGGWASWRRGQGRHGLAVDWAAWRNVGQAVTSARAGVEEFATTGISAFDPVLGLEALGYLLDRPTSEVLFAPVDWRRYAAGRGANAPKLVSELVEEAAQSIPNASSDGGASPVVEQLRQAPIADRRAALERHIAAVAAAALRLPIDQIEPTRTLGTLGLESLLALELRNRLATSLGLRLPATLAWNHPTVRALATFLARRLDLALDSSESIATADPVGSNAPAIAAPVDELSEEEALRALTGSEEVRPR